MTVKGGSYVVIPSFAVNDMHLKGNELLVFSVIWGFSQDGSSWFKGSRGYLADWCGASKGTVDNALAKLVEKGLVEKRKRIENGVTLCDYRVPQNFCPHPKNCDTPPQNLGGGTPKNEVGGTPKIMTHNLDVDILEDNSSERRGARAARFAPPTPEQLSEYCVEEGISIDCDRFLDYYDTQGWRLSNGNQMKDWRAAVRNWARHDSAWARPKPKPISTSKEEAMPWL